jgi:hypothetical protein
MRGLRRAPPLGVSGFGQSGMTASREEGASRGVFQEPLPRCV